MSDHDKSQAPRRKQDGRRARDRPQVSIRTDAFRFEMNRLPRRPRLPRWLTALLSSSAIVVEVVLHFHHIR